MQLNDVHSFANLYNAYLIARKQKRYRGEVLRYSYNLDAELTALQKELETRSYRVGAYRPFEVYEPKRRQIVALPFRDRIVQHALNNIIEPVFDRRMIYDSYACRVGKGTRQAARRVSYFLGKPENIYYLKMDVKSYFASIDRDILKTLARRCIDDEGVLWLLDTIFDSSPGPGMPIGNLMSQLFANVYLHELDHYCKNAMSVKYYLRYMDDIIVMSNSKVYLHALLTAIEDFLRCHLRLVLNNKTTIGKCRDGIEFVGYRIWSTHKLIKKASLARMKVKAVAWKNGRMADEKFMASMGSWIGHSFDTSSHRAVEKIMFTSMQEMQRRLSDGCASVP
jgi:retron-type reverse transcriptase